jgi:hypothetical protein
MIFCVDLSSKGTDKSEICRKLGNKSKQEKVCAKPGIEVAA